MAKRVPVQSRWGVDGCVVVARLWRKEAQAAQRPWNDKARPGQEKAKADDERWKKMSPDERLIHFPPSPSLGPSPPPPPPTDTKPSKKRGAASDLFDDDAPPRRRRGGGVEPTRTASP